MTKYKKRVQSLFVQEAQWQGSNYKPSPYALPLSHNSSLCTSAIDLPVSRKWFLELPITLIQRFVIIKTGIRRSRVRYFLCTNRSTTVGLIMPDRLGSFFVLSHQDWLFQALSLFAQYFPASNHHFNKLACRRHISASGFRKQIKK